MVDSTSTKGRILLFLLALCAATQAAAFTKTTGAGKEMPIPIVPGFRPPSVPLSVVNPYFRQVEVAPTSGSKPRA